MPQKEDPIKENLKKELAKFERVALLSLNNKQTIVENKLNK